MSLLFVEGFSTVQPRRQGLGITRGVDFCRRKPSSTHEMCSNSNQSTNEDNNNKEAPETTTPSSSLDWNWIREQVGVFRQLSLPYYQESKEGRWLLVGVLGLTFLNSGVSVVFSFLSKDFWNALSARDVTEFYNVLQKFVAALVVGAPVVTYYKYQREQLAVHWRQWMTTRTVTLYTQNRVYYQLEEQKRSGGTTTTSTTATSNNNGDWQQTNGSEEATSLSPDGVGIIDNPDQRIAEDVNTFTGYSLQLTVTVLTSVIDLVAFSVILYNIYPQLLVAVILYASIGTTVTTYLGQSLVGLNLWQLQREADLRYLLVRWRDNAESIAFYQGEGLEGAAVQTQLSSVISNRRDINIQQRNLEYFVNAYRYLVQILPIVVVAPQYFSGAVALGVISQAAGAFNHILNDLSLLINQFERLSSFSAGLERLSSFYQAMQQQHEQATTTSLRREQPAADSLQKPVNGDASDVPSTTTTGLLKLPELSVNSTVSTDTTTNLKQDSRPDMIQFESIPLGSSQTASTILSVHNLTLYTPDRYRVLVRDLSFHVSEGEHLLIVGPSGAGKSSMLRALAGLWTSGQGTITRPSDDIYFLPQRPYCTLGGSLKEQLLYPRRREQPLDVSAAEPDESMASSFESQNGDDNALEDNLDASAMDTSDERLLEILEKVDLFHVAQRAGNGNATAGLYSVQDWTNVLSLGEQQRLAFGRLLVHEPRLVILGELYVAP